MATISKESHTNVQRKIVPIIELCLIINSPDNRISELRLGLGIRNNFFFSEESQVN